MKSPRRRSMALSKQGTYGLKSEVTFVRSREDLLNSEILTLCDTLADLIALNGPNKTDKTYLDLLRHIEKT